jgi:hypothetical protein
MHRNTIPNGGSISANRCKHVLLISVMLGGNFFYKNWEQFKRLGALFLFIFLRITQVQMQTFNTHAHSPLKIHIRKPYLYKHLWKTVTAHLKIDEITTGTSLSTGTLPTTESTTVLNPNINLEKYEHTCQVKDLNLGGLVPPQRK